MRVRLRRWTDADLPVLEGANAPGMTVHLAGPETPTRVRRRHEQYIRGWDTTQPRMFTIRATSDDAPVGSIGWWESEWDGHPCLEAGWAVLPAFQGRGAATGALRLLLESAYAEGRRGFLMACPHTDNAASNAVCRKAGLTPRGAFDDDYRGVPMTLNAWTIDLGELHRGSGAP